MTRIKFSFAAFTLILVAGMATAGKPARQGYPFALTAEAAFERLAVLDKSSGEQLIPTKDLSFAEMCLVADGVSDKEKRKAYLTRIDEIEAAARKAVESAKTPQEKGEQLLKFLHAGPMSKGYESQQTDLHVILDTGKFNCVSSAALYNVIGRRLGLELRAVEIPEHVFSVLCDGDKRITIETTNARGFNPSDEAKKKQRTRDQREVGENGLAAIIAYNHGVALSKEKRFHEAVLANFRSLAIDPSGPGAAKNAVADLTNWPMELARSGEYEKAIAVLAVGSQIAPTESGIKNNHKVVWSEFADSRMKAGKPDEAVAIMRRAAKACPDGDFETRQAYIFARPAEQRMQAGEWEKALAQIDGGLKSVDPKARKVLQDMRVGLFLRWSCEEERKHQFEKALSVLKRAAAEEKDSRIQNNTLAIYDSWANEYMKHGQWADAVGVYERGLKQLPGDKHLVNNLAYCREQMKK